ncbi:DUF3489 domain-containing protein [Phenylobacterium immobile]|uniref:DUF3489 domain-containing protein n=1 Tax=Phenylobacterium immobile TaxID=21 RepID=UPI000ACA95FD|nr:DUF3489 domain-containing protein [Phenylobacterium immobile]
MKSKTTRSKAAAPAAPAPATSKLDRLVVQLSEPGGATLQALMSETGWQAHSVRGAIAGSLKKRGHSISWAKVDGVRRYAITQSGDAQ